MTNRPEVILRFTISLDGYLDDSSDERLILSNQEDFDLVDRLRSECDAILVGAETIRKDNPGLRIKNAAYRAAYRARTGKDDLLRATCTRSGNLPLSSKFFRDDVADKIVFCAGESLSPLCEELKQQAVLVQLPESDFLNSLVQYLFALGNKRILVEGGGKLITQFLSSALVDQLIISIAPIILGSRGGARFIDSSLFSPEGFATARLIETKAIGDMILCHYDFKRRQD